MSKTKKIRVSFPGYSAFQVTGSMTLIEVDDHKILIEAGLVQGASVLQDWKANARKLPFKPSEISYIFIGHGHADHMLLIPRLYAMGCNATIVAPCGTADLFRIMAKDSSFIISKDAEMLSKMNGKTFVPFYTEADVINAAAHFCEYEFGEIYTLCDWLNFRFTPSGHIINAAQIELWLSHGANTVKIGYTSDLGSGIPKRFANTFKPMEKCNLLIGESTYARELRPITIKDRHKDVEKIKTVVDECCIKNGGRVLIPIFSLDRSQNLLSILYDLFGKDTTFTLPVLIDSPLTIQMFNYMRTQLTGDELEYYEKMLSWPNLVWVEDYADSKRWQESDKPAVILAASGMMQAGRSRRWAALLLPDEKSHILFCGFSVEQSLASKIKNGRAQKTITIDGKKIKNRCGISDLHSFSGHMNRENLMKYYSDVQADKIALVHGEFEAKAIFAKELQNEIYKKNKTSKVICVNRSTEILI